MTDRKDALSTLYTRLIDSRDGYEAAQKRADSPMIQSLIAEMIAHRSRDAAQIGQYLSGLGASPSDDGSTLAAAHRAFLSLKDSVTGTGDAAVLQEIVRGEETLAEAYGDAIGSADAADPEFAFLREQHSRTTMKIDELKARAKAA